MPDGTFAACVCADPAPEVSPTRAAPLATPCPVEATEHPVTLSAFLGAPVEFGAAIESLASCGMNDVTPLGGCAGELGGRVGRIEGIEFPEAGATGSASDLGGIFEVIVRTDTDVETIRQRIESRLGPGTVTARATRWDAPFGAVTVAVARGRTVVRVWDEARATAFAAAVDAGCEPTEEDELRAARAAIEDEEASGSAAPAPSAHCRAAADLPFTDRNPAWVGESTAAYIDCMGDEYRPGANPSLEARCHAEADEAFLAACARDTR